jgi:hypothetical protein
MHSQQINNKNVENIRKQIINKINYNSPYYATLTNAGNVITDVDNFPYNRFFRGKYNNPNPTVMERQAGFRKVNNSCYAAKCQIDKSFTDYCFQYPCSVILPCNLKYANIDGKRQFLDIANKRGCVPTNGD